MHRRKVKHVLTLVYTRTDDFINHLRAHRMRCGWIGTILSQNDRVRKNSLHRSKRTIRNDLPKVTQLFLQQATIDHIDHIFHRRKNLRRI